MFIVFVNDNTFPFTIKIINGEKTIETRNKNTLKRLIGYRVGIAKTVKGKKPVIIGYVTISRTVFHSAAWLNSHRHLTLIPENSKYNNPKGKYCYYLKNAVKCIPYELPINAIRHGRSYAEI